VTAIPEFPGPPCDLCGQAEAMGSLMQLSDWSQTKFCGGCAPVFLRSVADAIGGVEAPEPDPPLELPSTETCPLCGQGIELADIPGHVDMHAADSDNMPGAGAGLVDGEPIESDPNYAGPGDPVGDGRDGPDGDSAAGSAQDHWASTKKVVRSTHGHRGGGRDRVVPPETSAP
jgi:hypothetical protein